MNKPACVYIITNKNHTVLYTGFTIDLLRRILEHKNKKYSGSFSGRYNIDKLVYFEWFETIAEAIEEEKRIKAGSRKQKINMINSMNRNWEDLYVDLLHALSDLFGDIS